jgi:cysteinyl-tRNA synthetase
MEVVQKYTNDFHQVMLTFNALEPDIEPTATGHLLEQLNMIDHLVDSGYAYESNGSVYFDIEKFNKKYNYGKLSGRKTEDLLNQTRELDGQSDKKNPLDFAIWKKAAPEHIMRWDTKWGDGFPGWHLECSVMSTKYLGDSFDIHGGGMDLKFPHHECEIAQNAGSHGKDGAKYWLHTNMLTVNGIKMSKSLGNSFLPRELISGNHELLDRGFSPMTIRFFMLQSHYASTLDFSNDALTAAQKGFIKLTNGLRYIKQAEYKAESIENPDENQEEQIRKICENCHHAMNDDFNTALTIGHLFNLLKKINSIQTGQLKMEQLGKVIFDLLKKTFIEFVEDVLGLKLESNLESTKLVEIILAEYAQAKEERNYAKVDAVRVQLKELGIVVKDMKTRVDWAFEE